MKVSGALKRLVKKIEHYKDHEFAGVLVSRTTNPINYFKSIALHKKRFVFDSKDTPKNDGIPQRPPEQDNSSLTSHRVLEHNIQGSDGGGTP